MFNKSEDYKVVKDKFHGIIKPLIKNKNILDFGSSGQYLDKTPPKNKKHLYSEMRKVTKSIIGVDLRKPNPHLKWELKKELVYGNAETINLKKQFDAITCCDLIEHVMNQGLLLQNCKRHLKDSGLLILSTPNAKSYRILFKTYKAHTLWHDKDTLGYLLKKNGFKINKLYYYYGNKDYPWYLNLIFKILGRFNQGMCIVCEKDKVKR